MRQSHDLEGDLRRTELLARGERVDVENRIHNLRLDHEALEGENRKAEYCLFTAAF